MSTTKRRPGRPAKVSTEVVKGLMAELPMSLDSIYEVPKYLVVKEISAPAEVPEVAESVAPGDKIYLGEHPVTGEPVYL